VDDPGRRIVEQPAVGLGLEPGSTVFDRKVQEVAKRLCIPAAQVRDVFAAYDAVTMEWIHGDEADAS
jgi:hypothetical protein